MTWVFSFRVEAERAELELDKVEVYLRKKIPHVSFQSLCESLDLVTDHISVWVRKPGLFNYIILITEKGIVSKFFLNIYFTKAFF